MNTEIITNDCTDVHNSDDNELTELESDTTIDEFNTKPQMLEVVSRNFQGKQLIIDWFYKKHALWYRNAKV